MVSTTILHFFGILHLLVKDEDFKTGLGYTTGTQIKFQIKVVCWSLRVIFKETDIVVCSTHITPIPGTLNLHLTSSYYQSTAKDSGPSHKECPAHNQFGVILDKEPGYPSIQTPVAIGDAWLRPTYPLFDHLHYFLFRFKMHRKGGRVRSAREYFLVRSRNCVIFCSHQESIVIVLRIVHSRPVRPGVVERNENGSSTACQLFSKPPVAFAFPPGHISNLNGPE